MQNTLRPRWYGSRFGGLNQRDNLALLCGALGGRGPGGPNRRRTQRSNLEIFWDSPHSGLAGLRLAGLSGLIRHFERIGPIGGLTQGDNLALLWVRPLSHRRRKLRRLGSLK